MRYESPLEAKENHSEPEGGGKGTSQRFNDVRGLENIGRLVLLANLCRCSAVFIKYKGHHHWHLHDKAPTDPKNLVSGDIHNPARDDCSCCYRP